MKSPLFSPAALVCTAALGLALPGPAALAQSRAPEVTMELTATAASRDLAFQQVLATAVDTLVARIAAPGSPAAAQARRAVPLSLARIVRVLREGDDARGYSVTAVVALPSGTAERAVLAAQPDLAARRVAVLIPESILRRPVPDPAAETELGRALIGAGFTVADLQTSMRLAEREALRDQPLTPQAAQSLATRLGADVLVTGEAFAEEYGAVTGGTRAYTSRLEVKVIDLRTGGLLYTEAVQASGIGATDAVAGKTALMNAGRVAGTTVPAGLLRALTGAAAPRGATQAVVLRLTGDVTFASVNRLVSALARTPGVDSASLRSLDTTGAVIDVLASGTAADLAARLGPLGVTVTGLNSQTLTGHF